MSNNKSNTTSLSAVPSDETQPDPRRWKALVVLCTATFIVILDGTIVFVAAPSIAVDLQLTPNALQWVLSSYLLAFGGLLLLGGRMADLLGRRRMFIAGGALLALSTLFCGLAWSPEVLIGSRVLQGVASAIMTPTALSILMNTFRQERERNKALGAWSSAGGVGGTVGALIGGPLSEGPGWGWTFYINIPVALVMIALAPMVLKESYDRNRVRTFDFAGALTGTGALVLLVWALVDAPTSGWSSGHTIGLFVAVAVLVAAFVVVERRSKAPLVPLRYFGTKAFVGGNLVLIAIGMAVHGGMGFIMTQYAQVVLGYSAVEFGLMFACMTILTIVGSTLAGGPLVIRFGARPVAIGALLMIGASCLILTNIRPNGTFASDMLLGMLLFGPGLGGGVVAATIAALAGVPERDSGMVSGVTTASFEIGGALGIAVLATVVVSKAAGPDPLTAMTTGFQAAWGVGILFAAVGIIAALFLLGRPRKSTISAATTPAETTPPQQKAA